MTLLISSDHNKPTMASTTVSMASTTLSMASSIVSSSPGVANAAQTTSFSASVSFRRHQCLFPDFHRIESAQTWPRRRVGTGTARAAKEDESTTQESPTSSPPPPPTPVSDKKAAAQKEIEKGQTTAIITGVISLLLAVGYLVLLQVLDTRGVNLVPPPPEAFDP